jgi:hypothetical protein
MSETPTGFFPGVPFADYCQMDGLNFHRLKHIHTSPLQYQHELTAPDKDTPAMRFGRMLHSRLLEPDLFTAMKVAEPCQAVLQSGPNKGRECGAGNTSIVDFEWRCGKHGGGEPGEDTITPAEAEQIEACVVAVRKHPSIRVLRAAGQCEVVLRWSDSRRSYKARLDKYIHVKGKRPLILDVKKVRQGAWTARKFGSDAVSDDRMYVAQAAWYCRAVEILTGEVPIFWWIVVEDSPPNHVAIYQMTEEQMIAGRNHCDAMLAILNNCEDTNQWPGREPGMNDVEDLAAPTWYGRQWNPQDR